MLYLEYMLLGEVFLLPQFRKWRTVTHTLLYFHDTLFGINLPFFSEKHLEFQFLVNEAIYKQAFSCDNLSGPRKSMQM